MKMLVVQHNDVEGPGLIKDWAKENGYEVTIVRPDKGESLNKWRTDQVDFLVVMGGNQSANDLSPRWIEDERFLIQRMHTAGKPIYGACLGSQQLAKSLGALVTKGTTREIGWLPVKASDQCPIDVPKTFTAFHWHQDQFTLPINSHRLFKTGIDENQGFISGNVAGVQFHLEMTDDIIKKLIKVNHDYIDTSDAPNAAQQSAEQIEKTTAPAEDKKILYQILDKIAKK